MVGRHLNWETGYVGMHAHHVHWHGWQQARTQNLDLHRIPGAPFPLPPTVAFHSIDPANGESRVRYRSPRLRGASDLLISLPI